MPTQLAADVATSFAVVPEPITLSGLLHPITQDIFLTEYWQSRPLLICNRQGHRGFGDLFPWKRLNEVLAQYPMLPPRMMLFQRGHQVAPREYIDTEQEPLRRIMPGRLNTLLSRGATLILNHADQLYEPLRLLMREFEKLLRIPIQANLYAAWGKDEAFPVHWDEQHTFIVQLAGEKQWTIYPPTCEAPIKSMRSEIPWPTGTPWLSHVISAGECLYVPRGWWHLVEPVGSVTLHLTITCDMPTGMSLMKWLFTRLSETEEMRRDVPLSTQEDGQYMAAIKTVLDSILSDDRLLDEFWSTSFNRTSKVGYPALPDLSENGPDGA